MESYNFYPFLLFRIDRLAESFYQTGDFFATSGVPRVERLYLPRRYYSLINTMFWAVMVLVPMLYYLINLFLSGSTVYFSIGVGIILLCKYSAGMNKIACIVFVYLVILKLISCLFNFSLYANAQNDRNV